MKRRDFLTTVPKAAVALPGTAYLLGVQRAAAAPRTLPGKPASPRAELLGAKPGSKAEYRFKIGMYLPELRMPFEKR